MVYLAVIRKSYARNLQYRWAHMANNFGSFLFGLLYVSVWNALLNQPGAASSGLQQAGYTAATMRSYIALAQTTIWLSFFTTPGLGIGKLIRTGEVAMELARPVDFFLYTISKEAGFRLYDTIYRAVPMAIMFALTTGFPAPASWQGAVGFALSAVTGAYVTTCMHYLIGASGFWTKDITWAHRLFMAVATALAGISMPIELFPGFLGKLSLYLPFASQCYYSITIYLGLRGLEYILVNIAWGAILTVACLAVTARGRRRLEVQGG